MNKFCTKKNDLNKLKVTKSIFFARWGSLFGFGSLLGLNTSLGLNSLWVLIFIPPQNRKLLNLPLNYLKNQKNYHSTHTSEITKKYVNVAMKNPLKDSSMFKMEPLPKFNY